MSAGAHTPDEYALLCRVLPFAERTIMYGIIPFAMGWPDRLQRDSMHWQAGAWQLSRQF